MRSEQTYHRWFYHIGMGPINNPLVIAETDPTRLLSGVSLSEILDLLDSSYDLCHVDYNSSLDNSLESVNVAIQTGSMESIWEENDEWIGKTESDAVHWVLDNNLPSEIEHHFDLLQDWEDFEDVTLEDYDHIKEGTEAIIEDYRDWITDTIYERNDSDPMNDLLKNTSDQATYYPTDLNWEDLYGDDFPEKLWAIKKTLKILKKDTTWDKVITQMMYEAYNCGSLVIYFTADVQDWVQEFDAKRNTIVFTDPYIALPDHWNGAGSHCQLKGHTVSLPFNRGLLQIDAVQHYNYTHSVCGMSNDWCDGTEVKLTHKRYRKQNETPTQKS